MRPIPQNPTALPAPVIDAATGQSLLTQWWVPPVASMIIRGLISLVVCGALAYEHSGHDRRRTRTELVLATRDHQVSPLVGYVADATSG